MGSVDVSVSAIIKRPRPQVAAYAAEIDHVQNWYENIKSVVWKTEPPTRIGSRAAFVAHFLGKRLAYTYEVVELVPNEQLVMRTSEGPFPMETSYYWEDSDSTSTRMTLRNRGMPVGFSSLMAPFMSFMIRRATTKDLARLKNILESMDVNESK